MSDPKDTPAERPKLWERRDDKPVDKPAENPTPTDGPKNKPDLLPRDPDNPSPDPEPAPTPPTDLPKIATERLMDVDVDGIPDHMGGRDPILGDGDDLGDIVAGGPPAGQTVAADSTQSSGDVSAPPSGQLGNFEIQDVFDTPDQGGRLDQPSDGITLNYEEIKVTMRDGDMTDRPVDRFEEIKVTARDDGRPLDDVVGIRKDSGEAHLDALADIVEDAPGVVMSGGSTMIDAATPKRSDGDDDSSAVMELDKSSPNVHDAASPESKLAEPPSDEAWEILSFEATEPTGDPGELTDQIDGLADQPEGDDYYIITMEHVVDTDDGLVDG